MKMVLCRPVLALLLGATCLFAWAAGSPPRTPAPLIDPVMLAGGFLNYHPDLRYRLRAMEAYKSGKLAVARTLFERAAFYADKPSQGMMAEMLWKGEGGTRDPSLAYAWMDLAAERGYRPLLIQRERYWDALLEPERAEAIARGGALYLRYGDAVAKPRYANVLRRGRSQGTGSRTGFTGNLTVIVPMAGGEQSIDGSKFYDPRFWDPDQYWAWQDTVWRNLRPGVVSVGELEQVESPASRTKPPADGKD